MKRLLILLLIASPSLAQAPKPAEKRTISDADRQKIERAIKSLETALSPLADRAFGDDVKPSDALADASVALKAARWILKHGEFYAEDSVASTLRVLELGEKRAKELAEGKHAWTKAKGGVARGFVSKIDGSVQPYAVSVPPDDDGSRPMRLDVILHGRDATLTEVKFLLAHDGSPHPEGEPGLLLHVFGRGNNAYRWAGETDVFEAIEAVRRNYRVDERRILLRGFSMGGAGAWQLGLRHPSEWCAVEAGAGFTETKGYARVKELSPVEEKALHIYDAVDYAANARMVPVAGYGGEDDPQKAASENILKALERQGITMTSEGLATRADGLAFLRLIGARTGHKVDPASEKVLKSFRDAHAEKGRADPLAKVRFVTFTLKTNVAGPIRLIALRRHYEKASVEADVTNDVATVKTLENVEIVAIDRDWADRVRLGGAEFPLRSAVKGLLPEVFFRKTAEGWEPLDYDASLELIRNTRGRKAPGVQGPIDDAFTGPFVCVRGTGKPLNEAADAEARRRLDAFAATWSEFLRADLPVVDDTALDAETAASKNLILFGDPGSNRMIARFLGDLPIGWTRTTIRLGGEFSAADHLPSLAAPNPLNRSRYLVVNSGHTFGADAFRGTNALLYPRLGDWGVTRLDGGVAASGFFDEKWRP